MRAAVLCMAITAVMSPRTVDAASTYYEWITGCLESISADMPHISTSAEQAARHFVNDDYSIGAWADPVFVSEFSGRAGGLMPVSNPKKTDGQVSKAIVLVSPTVDSVAADISEAAALKRPDNFLVLVAGPNACSLVKDMGLTFDSIINTHSAENGGLVKTSDGKWVLPTDRAASIAALWAWTGEFVGACTRLGKMPPVWQSLSCPGSEKRAAKYKKMRFHDETPIAVQRGRIGKDYLSAVSKLLTTIHTNESGKIRTVVSEARRAISNGRRFYVCGAGHATKFEPSKLANPNVFTFLPEGDTGEQIQPGDLLLCVGYDAHWLKPQLGPVSHECRKRDGRIAWSLSTYGGKPVPGVEPGETIIDQHWAIGDAVVPLPGYDVNILPSSGVLAEAVLWMVSEELLSVPR